MKAGVQSPINTQDRAVLCFANSILKAQNPQELLYEVLMEQFCLYFRNHCYQLRDFNNYHRAILVSTGLAKLVFKRVPYKCFPGNIMNNFARIPTDLKAHFDTKHFKVFCKTYFKYKCPHAQHKHPHDCDACVELISAKKLIINQSRQCWVESGKFSLNYVYSENFANVSNSVTSAVSNEMIQSALNLIPLYES